jgi:Metal binding domain of Ada
MRKSLETERMAAATTVDPRWLSVVKKDKKSDGDFYYSVRTTGCTAAHPAEHGWHGQRTCSSTTRRTRQRRLDLGHASAAGPLAYP